jgi:hypothetical protein
LAKTSQKFMSDYEAPTALSPISPSTPFGRTKHSSFGVAPAFGVASVAGLPLVCLLTLTSRRNVDDADYNIS